MGIIDYNSHKKAIKKIHIPVDGLHNITFPYFNVTAYINSNG
jgi:hypothetical protein